MGSVLSVRWRRRLAFGLVAVPLFLSAAATTGAQTAPGAFPTATTIAALTAYPNFYHLKPIVVRGDLSLKDDQARLLPPGGIERGVEMLVRGEHPSGGSVEVRGQFWDVGRLSPDDPHAAAYDLQAFVRARLGDRWPAHGEMLVVNATTVTPSPPPSTSPSLRQLSLDPGRYEGQQVTVSGQFAGRNILGDLPQAPRISRTDFVLRNAGGAVWVSGVVPGGRGWRLDPESKLDTDQWLQVRGIVRLGEGLVWIEGKTLARTKADEAPPDAQAAAPIVLPAPPPEVIFTLPAQDETDVPPTTSVRIQTSRDLDAGTFDRHITASYVGQPTGAASLAFTATFDRGNRVLELKFDQPLERFRTVRVDLSNEIKGTDGQALKPFTLTFSVGP